jgi:hypothetical protein
MFALLSFTLRSARSAYAATLRANSSISFIKWMAAFTKIKQPARSRPIALPHIFPMTSSANATPIFRKIGVLRSVSMAALAHFFLFASFIVSLLNSSSPTAISWLVIAVIVDSVYLIAKGARPHICNKIIKASKPSIANGDAPPTIILPTPVVGIIATPLHARPDAIKRFSFFPIHGFYNKNKKQNCQYISLGDGYAF